MGQGGEREVVKADPALRRRALVAGGIVLTAAMALLASVPRVLVAASDLSQRSRGEAVAMFAAFIAPFVLLAVVGGVDTLRRSLRTWQERRFPPRGMLVLRDTPVIDGPLARVLGALGCTLGALLLVLALLLSHLAWRAGRILWYGCPRAQHTAVTR
jgi:hypothetical protein